MGVQPKRDSKPAHPMLTLLYATIINRLLNEYNSFYIYNYKLRL